MLRLEALSVSREPSPGYVDDGLFLLAAVYLNFCVCICFIFIISLPRIIVMMVAV